MKVFTPYGDHARIRRMLHDWFGPSDGEKYLAHLRHLAESQRRRWPWFGRYLADSPRRLYDLLDHAVDELILLTFRQPDVDPAVRPPGGKSLIVEAWSRALAGAWREVGPVQALGYAGRFTSLDAWLEDHPHREPTREGEPDVLEVRLDGLNPQYQRLLAGRAMGLTFREMAPAEGVVYQALAWRFRRAVGALIRRNPWMAERWGLVPCRRKPVKDCPVCNGFDWHYSDGRTLGSGRHL